MTNPIQQALAAVDEAEKRFGPVAWLHVIRDALRLAAQETEARWAVRVLDAWAVKHGVMAPAPCFHWFTSKVDGAPLPRWRIFNGLQAVGGHQSCFVTADSARIACAQLLVASDPELSK